MQFLRFFFEENAISTFQRGPCMLNESLENQDSYMKFLHFKVLTSPQSAMAGSTPAQQLMQRATMLNMSINKLIYGTSCVMRLVVLKTWLVFHKFLVTPMPRGMDDELLGTTV